MFAVVFHRPHGRGWGWWDVAPSGMLCLSPPTADVFYQVFLKHVLIRVFPALVGIGAGRRRGSISRHHRGLRAGGSSSSAVSVTLVAMTTPAFGSFPRGCHPQSSSGGKVSSRKSGWGCVINTIIVSLVPWRAANPNQPL